MNQWLEESKIAPKVTLMGPEKRAYRVKRRKWSLRTRSISRRKTRLGAMRLPVMLAARLPAVTVMPMAVEHDRWGHDYSWAFYIRRTGWNHDTGIEKYRQAQR